MSEEKLLIKQAKKGDVAAFERLIAEYQIYCYNIALGMLKSQEDAKDVSQEALVKVYQKIATFNGKSTFSTWLYRIVVNSCLDFIKKQKKLQLIKDDYDTAIDQVATTHDGVADQAIKNELAAIIARSMKQLSAKQRAPIVLRDYLGFSYQDVADILNLPLGTLKSRLIRARSKLREIITSDAAFSYALIEGEEVL